MNSNIMAVSRLRMGSDGAGVSTLVAFWGCPLQCRYCVNWFCHDGETPREPYTAEALADVLNKDDIYFKMTGGGIAFGGGEPLLEAGFIHDVCQLADPLWKRRIETSLYSEWDRIQLLIGDIDEWIIDIKDLQPSIYKKYTGQDNDMVISNLKKLIDMIPAEKVLLRVPHIPKFNSLDDVRRSVEVVEKMGYHRIERFEYCISDPVTKYTSSQAAGKSLLV